MTRSIGLLFGAFLLVACNTEGPSDSVRTSNQLFPEVHRMSLEEVADDPIVEITSFTPRVDGGFIVVDGPANRIREYDASGQFKQSFGRSGEGPGELQNPSAAVEGPSGELHVVQRGSPRRWIFWPTDSVSTARLPGHYGFWLDRVSDGFIVGIGTREERFVVLSYSGETRARFGRRDPRVQETPFWLYFVEERAAVLEDRIFINSSFSPMIRVFSASGDSLYSFGTPPPNWTNPTNPEIGTIASAADRAKLEEWARSFTVVTGLAATDSVVIVQYGQHDPQPNEPYHVVRSTADVYTVDGRKLTEGLELSARILAGGEQIYLLESKPPEGWTISVREWAGKHR